MNRKLHQEVHLKYTAVQFPEVQLLNQTSSHAYHPIIFFVLFEEKGFFPQCIIQFIEIIPDFLSFLINLLKVTLPAPISTTVYSFSPSIFHISSILLSKHFTKNRSKIWTCVETPFLPIFSLSEIVYPSSGWYRPFSWNHKMKLVLDDWFFGWLCWIKSFDNSTICLLIP